MTPRVSSGYQPRLRLQNRHWPACITIQSLRRCYRTRDTLSSILQSGPRPSAIPPQLSKLSFPGVLESMVGDGRLTWKEVGLTEVGTNYSLLLLALELACAILVDDRVVFRALDLACERAVPASVPPKV